jgi:Lrp/AsnC family transcriptional regulator, leucine-responsive regulatory protein
MASVANQLDGKDHVILLRLDEDARQPVSKLAKAAHLNRRVAGYRIDRMIDEGIIRKFVLYLNVARIGYIVTTFYARFHDTKPKDEQAIFSYLKDKKCTMWVAAMDGRFNLGVTISTKSVSEVTEFFDEMRDKYGPFLGDIHMANIITAWRFPRKHLAQDIRGKMLWSKESEKAEEISLIDRKVLAALGEDGRMRAVEIAKRVGISADAVADRIGKLREKGVIAGIGVLLDHLALNRRHFRSFITFHNLNTVRDKFLQYCYEHQNAVQVKRMLGPWEWEVDLEVSDETELRKAHFQFKEHFADSVRSTSFVSIYKVHKFDMGNFLLG